MSEQKRKLKENVGRRQLLKRLASDLDLLDEYISGTISSDFSIPQSRNRELVSTDIVEILPQTAHISSPIVESVTPITHTSPQDGFFLPDNGSSSSPDELFAGFSFSERNKSATPAKSEANEVIQTISSTSREEFPSHHGKRKHCSDQIHCLENTLEKLLIGVNACLYKLDKLTTIVNRLVASTNNSHEEFDHAPCTSIAELKELEAKLEDEAFRTSFVSFISNIGGAQVKDGIKNVWLAIATDAVWKEYNWEGRKHSGRNKIKSAIKDSILVKVILKGLKCRFAKLDSHVFKTETSAFLRHAPKRFQGRKTAASSVSPFSSDSDN